MKKVTKIGEYGMTYQVDPFKDLGYSVKEWESIDWLNDADANEKYVKRLDAFNLKCKKIEEEKKIELKKVKMCQYVNHWYSILSKEEIEELIEKSRNLSDQVFEKIISKESLPQMINYYNNLKYRVDHSHFKIVPAELKKMSNFPSYDHGTKSLTGSRHSFMKLWSHVYSIRKSTSISTH